jgi:hypothetical protein
MGDEAVFLVRDANRRVLLETSDGDEAKAWVENHFPRHHANSPGDPVAPDVVIVDPDGIQHAYVGGKWHEDTSFKSNNGRFEQDDAPRPVASKPTKATSKGA